MSKTREFTSIVPLAHFESEINEIRFDENLRLRRTNFKELISLSERAVGYTASIESALHDVEYVIEKRETIDTSKRWVFDWNEDAWHVIKIVRALRLLKEGTIETPTAFMFDSSNQTYSVSNQTPTLHYFEELYFLKQQEISELKILWEKMEEVVKQKPKLMFPLLHFNKAFERVTDEEALLDYIIAFESIIFSGEDRAIEPAGKVVGLAVGMLLGTSVEEREKIKNTFVKAYEIRNAYVHGNMEKLKKRKLTVNVITPEVENYLRRSLRKFVEE
jgi:hypothetical protein